MTVGSDEGPEGTTVVLPLEGSATIQASSIVGNPTNSDTGYTTAWKRSHRGNVLCACCPRWYLSQSGLPLDFQSGKKDSRRYFRQFALDTASDEELEMILQEEMERLEDLELLVLNMQNSTDEHAPTILAKLRTGASMTELMGHNSEYVSNDEVT